MIYPHLLFLKLGRRMAIAFTWSIITAIAIVLSPTVITHAQSLVPNTTVHQTMTSKIVVNQVGYRPDWSKQAFILNMAEAETTTAVEVINQQTQAVELILTPTSPASDPDTGIQTQSVDFSKLTQPGDYFLRMGTLESVPFSVGDELYQEPLATLLRSYYLQRCGVELDDPVTGIYHLPCHVGDGTLAHDDTIHPQDHAIAASGGWHDAGDYGKYVATTTVTIGRLLSMYEQHPDQFWDGQLQIPESGNGHPDVLDEMKVGLDWLLHMQRDDGAVYRKLSGKEWPIGLGPSDDHQSRYVYGISTPETAKFAAVMALAARVYKEDQPQLARQYEASAEAAWNFLEQHPAMIVREFEGDNSGSGPYLYSEWDRERSLTTDLDDRLWAGAELAITTPTLDYDTEIEHYLNTFDYSLFEWKDPSPLGLVNYRLTPPETASPKVRQIIKQKLVERADGLLETVNNNPYRIANDRYIWGSNKMVAEEGLTLAYAYRWTGDRTYYDAAVDQLDYLLGRNPFDQTFITGIGTHPVQHTNHLFAKAKKIYIPGLLVGGPNADAQDNIAPKNQGLLSYIDSEDSYATNEYAIDYNASLIALITELNSM